MNKVLLILLLTTALNCNPNDYGSGVGGPAQEARRVINYTDKLWNSIIEENEGLFFNQLNQPNRDFNAKDPDGNTPLHHAARSYDIRFLYGLLARGASVLEQNEENKTPAHVAAENGNAKGLSVLINENHDLIDVPDNGGNIPLHYAAGKNALPEKPELLINAVKTILSFNSFVKNQGKDIVNYENSSGSTPLHYALSEDIASLLIQNGADVNSKNNTGDTPLHFAIRNLRYNVASVLITNNSDVSSKNSSEKTPLHFAAQIDNARDLIDLLLEKGANINTKDTNGYTPLHFAVFSQKVINVKELLQKGASTRSGNIDGNTPLHVAIEASIDPTVNSSIIKEIISSIVASNNDSLNYENNRKQTPLDLAIAIESPFTEMLQQMLRSKNIEDSILFDQFPERGGFFSDYQTPAEPEVDLDSPGKSQAVGNPEEVLKPKMPEIQFPVLED